MVKQVMIMVVIDDDWNSDLVDFLHEANDALVKHDVVMYVEDCTVTDENYQIPVSE